jgi:N-acetyl-anhydromuramyl-L-alanine amidase AmpD
MTYNDNFILLVKSILSEKIEFPHLKAVMLAQAMLESGRGTTKLATEHLNFWGLKYRSEMAGIATPIYYATDTEINGGAEFCKFKSHADAVKGYWQFINRSPYAGYKQNVNTAQDYLKFIGKTFCPPAYSVAWINAHQNKNYHEYILDFLLPEAEQLIKIYADDKPTIGSVTIDGKTENFKYIDYLEMYLKLKIKEGFNQITMSKKDVVAPPVKEPIDNNPNVELWIPFAKKFHKEMRAGGTYRKLYPEFLLVHFTAGRDGTGTLDYGISKGYNFLLITRDGMLHQASPLNKWGYHAGESFKEGYGDSVSEFCVGVEMSAAGKCEEVTVNGVKKYKAYFHSDESEYFSLEEVRYSAGNSEKAKGWYHKYTPEQEATLIKLLAWLYANNPKVFKIDDTTGHENVATPKGRKNDPSAALSMSMAELIKKAKELIA